MVLEDDPALGAALANYPSDRARLLVIGGAILAVVWLVVTVALLNVEEGQAAAITILVMGAATVIVGWYVAHLWNREVVLYARLQLP
jgi:VIT1/CCC1 family predicted Fe2+/Mn2+ transporter